MTNNNQKEAWFPGWKKQTGGDLQPVNVREGWAAIGQYDSYQDNVTAYKEALNASIGGLPLKYAELADDPAFAMNPMTGRWARTSAGESEVLFYDAHGAFGSGRTGTPISADSSMDTRVTIFHNQDYRSVTVGADGVEAFVLSGFGHTGSEVHLGANPFSGAVEGIKWYQDNQAYNVQRFRMWNIPEFLWKPGTVVINTMQRRIYFVAPSELAEEDYKMIDWKRKDTSNTHQVTSSDPYYYSRISDGTGLGNGIQVVRNPIPVGQDSLLEISIPMFEQNSADRLSSECIKVIGGVSDTNPNGLIPSILIKDVKFGNGLRTGINIEDASNFSVKNAFFRNFGAEGLKLRFCKNATVEDCLFRGAYRHQLVLQNGKALYPDGLWKEVDSNRFQYALGEASLLPDNKPIKFDSMTRDAISHNLVVKNCSFTGAGEVYPEAKGIRMLGYPVGTVIEGCKFSDMAAVAVHVSGINTTVRNCQFTDVCKDVTDSAAIYTGRSWMKLGTFVDNNTFNGTYRKTPDLNITSYYGAAFQASASIPAAVEMDSRPNACAYFDENQFGACTYMNSYQNSYIGVKINRGRFIAADDLSHASVPKTSFLLPENEPAGLSYSGLGLNANAYYQNFRELGSLFSDSSFGTYSNGVLAAFPTGWQTILDKISTRSWINYGNFSLEGWDTTQMDSAYKTYHAKIAGATSNGGRDGTFPISRMLMTDESDLNFTGFKTINNSPAYKNGYIARRN